MMIICSQDKGIEFGIENAINGKKGKRETTERIELPNQENIRKRKLQANPQGG